ncbi:MAG: tetratricopeptide repeat protein [Pseudomonadota bacterium]|nr:tetratricopeptide repeat protein [Pseudomonadota bacterium]
MRMARPLPLALTLVGLMLIGGCASPPAALQGPPASLPNGVTVEQMVASIRDAGTTSQTELDIQPLRDPQVEDLRQQAEVLQSAGDYQAAAALLQQALEVNPDDPAVLQEAAEAHVYLWRFDEAEEMARRAQGLGSGVGPLCRRHWATVEQIAQARLAMAADPATGRDDETAARIAQQARVDVVAAREARQACTVSAPQRF